MVLGEQSIRSADIITRPRPNNFRSGSYDLAIRDLITPDGDVVSEFLLPPQGIIKVISAEVIKMPESVVGYVFVKTKLCNEGVLALNIGIVDPGFNGPLQSTLINFGKTKIRLRSGDIFSRISFHPLDQPAPRKTPLLIRNYNDVRRNAIAEIDKYLAPTFLDIEKTSEKAAEKAFGDFKGAMLKIIPSIAIGVAILTFLLNFGNMWMLFNRTNSQNTEKSNNSIEKLEIKIKKLEDENTDLKKQIGDILNLKLATPQSHN